MAEKWCRTSFWAAQRAFKAVCHALDNTHLVLQTFEDIFHDPAQSASDRLWQSSTESSSSLLVEALSRDTKPQNDLMSRLFMTYPVTWSEITLRPLRGKAKTSQGHKDNEEGLS